MSQKKKICMVGSYGVGKTSLVARYVRGIFSEKYFSTIGVKIDQKSVEYKDSLVTLILWDLYGEDQKQQVHMSYLKGASGYFLVVDPTRPETIDVTIMLQERIAESIGELPFIVLFNKNDLKDEWDMEALKKIEEKGWTIMETSAKTGEAVEDAFYNLTDVIIGDN